MKKKYKVNEFITEENNKVGKEILHTALGGKSFDLLISPMKTGKTTFIMEELEYLLKFSDIQQIFITPVLSLMNDIKSKYPKSIKCNGEVKEIKIKDSNTIISTPESIPKAIKACEEERKKYYIVYDEMHQVILNATFRPGTSIPLQYYKNELCIGFLGMSATPEPLGVMNFDNFFKVTAKEKFIQADETIIVKDFTQNIDNRCNFIKYTKEVNPNNTVFARMNNKEDIKAMQDKLNNCVCWYREKDGKVQNSKYIKDMDKLEDTLKGQDIKGVNYVLCTSLIDVGVELQLENKPIVIDFIDNNSTIADDIQFAGRFRQGIEKLYLVGNLNNPNPDTKPKNFKKEYDKELKKIINIINALNTLTDKNTVSINGAIKYNAEKDLYELNECILMENIFKKCMNFYLQTDTYLKLFLERHETFNTNKISSISFNDLDIDKTSKVLQEEKKEIKDTIKKCEEEFLKEVKSRNIDDKVLEMILNYELVQSNDLWRIKRFDDVVTLWKNEHLEEYRKRYKQILEILKKTKKNQLYLLELALVKKNIKFLQQQFNFISYNTLYDIDKQLDILNKDMLTVYSIRDYIIKIKSKERDVYLSDKFKIELLNHLKTKKSLSKMSPKQLDKHLNMIYNITHNNQNKDIIKSIKFKI